MTNARLQGCGVLLALLKPGTDVSGLGTDDEGALEAPTLSWGPQFALRLIAVKVGLRFALEGPPSRSIFKPQIS